MKQIKKLLSLCLAMLLVMELALPGYALGQRLSGTVTSYGDAAAPITVELIPEGSTEAAQKQTVTGNSTDYCFDAVSTGAYTLSISKAEHVTRTYRVRIDGTDALQDVKLCFSGDVNGDGRINIGDVSRAYAHVRAVSLITDTYTRSCADFNGDGRVNVGDTSRLYSRVKNGQPAVKNVTLSVWTPYNDQQGADSWLATMEQAFQKAHPEYKITWENSICHEGDAGYRAGQYPEGAADVYMYANDQMGTLVEAGAVTKLGGTYLDQVRQDNSQTMIDTVTYTDSNVYGFPVANNTWFMYYNKKMFSEDDVKSLDTMLEKGKVAFPWDTAWYSGTFFLANGGTLFGKQGNDASAGIQFGEANGGYEAALKMLQLMNHPNMENDCYGMGHQYLIEGTVGAYFSGSWDYDGLYTQLGDNLGATQLPTVEIGGEQKQMKAFAGSKAIGVNPYADEPALAMAFAAYLATAEAQKLRYEKCSVIPATQKLTQDPDISRNIVAVAEMNTVSNASVVQPVIPEMASYWTPMSVFCGNMLSGDITEKNYQKQVDLLMKNLNAQLEDDGEDDDWEEDTDDQDGINIPQGNDFNGVTLKVWASSEDQYSSNSWLIQMEEAFMEANPSYKINWENRGVFEGDVPYVFQDAPEAGADVYLFANDQLDTLVQEGFISKLEGAYLDQVREDNSQAMVNTVTHSNGNVYGFPVANNTWFMYYNKEIFSEEDVKSLDTMLEKGKVVFPWTNAWYGGSFFMANGGTLFGEQGNDASAGIQFGKANGGYEAAEKMMQLAKHPNMAEDTDGLGWSGLVAGTVGAMFSGSWEYPGLYDQLGDSLGIAQLPMVEIDGQQKQMKSFLGSRAVGVNPHTQNADLAMEFAAFLASKASQKARYEYRGVIPAATDLAQDADIQQDPLAVAEMNTVANAAVVQPNIPEMGGYWGPMGSFCQDILNDGVNADNYRDAVDVLMTALNGEEEMPDHEEPVPEAPDSYPITVRFHYHRPNGDYEGWNGWIWDRDAISQVDPPYDLVEENGEMIATVKLKPGTCQVGYIFRLDEWADKDIYEDQFVDITGIISGTVDVYVESGIKGHTVILADDVISGYIPVALRVTPGRGQVMVLMSAAMTDRNVDENTFEVYCNGKKLTVTKIININQYYYLTISEELEAGIYTVHFDEIDLSVNFDSN